MSDIFKSLIVKYLSRKNVYSGENNWDIIENEEFGRCLIAKKDIEVNELIFCDFPFFHGPRNNNYVQIFCVSCYKNIPKLSLCNNCFKFPLCDECKTKRNDHTDECQLLSSWKFTNNHYSKFLFRALTVIRGFLLDENDKELMYMMASHQHETVQNIEVERILNEFEDLNAESDIVIELKKISSILNTNAFELSILNSNDSIISLRGLFPLAAVMNHGCIPNCRYTFDREKVMKCNAAKPIKKGEQIFNSYTKILWGTSQRRAHLYYSKNFSCKCNRCIDSTEHGSHVSSIKCIRTGCDGLMVSTKPLLLTSQWKCNKCTVKLDYARVSRIHDILSGQIFNKIQNESISNLNNYLKKKLSTFVPKNNQFTIEVKLQIILKMKPENNYEMTIDSYLDIIGYCNDILDILGKLNAGECFIKGLLLYELASSEIKLAEIKKENISDDAREKIKSFLKESWAILKDSISQPKDINRLIECVNETDVTS